MPSLPPEPAERAPLTLVLPSRQQLLEMVRFGAVGATSAGIYLVFWMPLHWAVPSRLWLTATIAYLLSMVVNYVLQRSFTFRSNRRHQEAVGRFLVVQTVGLILNAVVLEYTANHAHWPTWLGQGLGILCVAIWSYATQKIWVFVGARRDDPDRPVAEA